MIIFFIWLVVLIAALALHLRQMHSAFSKHGIKYLNPAPLLGNMINTIFLREHFAYDVLRLYGSFPKDRFVGRYEFTNKAIMLRDLDLVKKITVKDFEVFLDHRDFGGDTFFGRTLILMRGQEWKDMRSTLSPAFTSSKIRLMVPFMVEVGDQMIESLKKRLKDSKEGYIDIDCKDLTTRYGNDVIASCAFGLKVDSQTEQNNQFYLMGKTVTNFNFFQMLKFFMMMNVPKIAKMFKWDIISDSVKNFFKNLVLDTMKEREMHKIIRPDMIHLLMEAKKGKLSHDDVQPNDDATGFATVDESSVGLRKVVNREWSDNDLVAQAFLFFVAGFETISSSVCFLLYELAVNPDVQDRLAKEIREYDAKNGGKFDFNSIQSMKYMDMVVSELLRRWPVAVATDRICDKDYNLGKPNANAEKDFIVRKGAGVMISAFAFHHDPQYFPEPEKFDPDRFSDENKHKINPNAYMPFGVGPRNCIGSRFALCEMKVITYQILRYMELSPCEKTCIPAKLATDNMNLRLQGGHWLRFRLRK
uniref:unspecific monooxygenase n=1 Tax=Spodoptera exigua TaxID=7107 RepID=A0A2D1QTX1_SPOEX|nr:cytochrome P450 [Spodoptera exigua]